MYRPIRAVGLERNGQKRIRGEREGGWPAGTGQPRRLSIAGGEEHSGEHGKGATVHGKRIPWHREEAKERGVMTGPKRWPEGAAVAAVAMAGVQEHSELAATALGTI